MSDINYDFESFIMLNLDDLGIKKSKNNEHFDFYLEFEREVVIIEVKFFNFFKKDKKGKYRDIRKMEINGQFEVLELLSQEIKSVSDKNRTIFYCMGLIFPNDMVYVAFFNLETIKSVCSKKKYVSVIEFMRLPQYNILQFRTLMMVKKLGIRYVDPDVRLAIVYRDDIEKMKDVRDEDAEAAAIESGRERNKCIIAGTWDGK